MSSQIAAPGWLVQDGRSLGGDPGTNVYRNIVANFFLVGVRYIERKLTDRTNRSMVFAVVHMVLLLAHSWPTPWSLPHHHNGPGVVDGTDVPDIQIIQIIIVWTHYVPASRVGPGPSTHPATMIVCAL